MPTKNPPPAKAEGADAFWEKPKETPVADPNVPIAGVAAVEPLVRVEGAPPLPDPAGATIPDVLLAPNAGAPEQQGPTLKAGDEATLVEPGDDGRKTPAEWARELGHIDAPALASIDPLARFETDKCGKPIAKPRPIRAAKGWIFAATKQHAGWGTTHPDDVRLTRDEYEAAVKEALGTSVAPLHAIVAPAQPKAGQPVYPEEARPKPHEWRADARKTPAEIEELNALEAAANAKGGG